MKPATTALINYLNANDNVVVADLYTFALVDGTMLRYVDYPLSQLVIPASNFPGSPLNFSGSGNKTFIRGPKFSRSKVTTKIGIEPATLDLNVYPNVTDLIGTLTWQEFNNIGGFDNATVELDRFFMPVGNDGVISPVNTNLGAIVWFYGRRATSDTSRSVVNFKIKALINILQQQQMPRRLFQAGCTHVYGDAMCGYDRVNGRNGAGTSTGVGATTTTAATGSTQTQLIAMSGVSAFYAQGTCKGLTGANAGVSRGILSISGSLTITLSRLFPFPIVVGDTFQLLPGCDHTMSTCNNLMQNLARYGGFDYIPPPELAF